MKGRIGVGALLGIALVCSGSSALAQGADEEAIVALEGYYIALQDGDVEWAAEGFEALVSAYPDYGAAHGGMAAIEAARGDWVAAVGHARTATQLDPTIPLAHSLLCRGLVATGQPGAALDACEAAMFLDPDDPVAYQAGCAAAVARYSWTQADGWCGAGLERDPTSYAMRWMYGVALSNLGSTSQAESQCIAATELAPAEPMGWYCAGSNELAQADFGAALAACSTAIEVGPDHALGYYCRGMAHLGYGNYDEASSDCERAVSIAPNEALGHYCLGRIARDEGRYADAEVALERALELNDRLVEARGSLGDTLTLAGDLAGGEVWLRDALAHNPTGARYAQLGRNLYDQGRFEEAMASFASALEVLPGHAQTLASLAACARQLGDFEVAFAHLEEAATADPANPAWFVVLVNTALALENPGRATEYAIVGTEAHPLHPELALGLCQAHIAARSWTDAESACVRASSLLGDSPEASGLLGVAYLQQGRSIEAETALRAAVGYGTRDANIYVNLGNVLLRQGNHAAASDAIQSALAINDEPASWWFMLYTAQNQGGIGGAQDAACEAAEREPTNPEYAAACNG